MNDEIKEILDRLERIDHKEYSGGFEFADSSTFDEMARCFEERKKMADYITNLQESEAYYYGQYKDYKSRCEKAVEYIENTPLYETTYDYNTEEELEIQNVSDETASNKLLDILNGRSDE